MLEKSESAQAYKSPKLKTEYGHEIQHRKSYLINEVRQFSSYQYFWYEKLFYCVIFVVNSQFSLFLISKSTLMFIPQKGSSGVAINDIFS